jgi:hypothetical protein
VNFDAQSMKEVSMKKGRRLYPDRGVTLYFDGLMLICFTKDNRCQLGLYTAPMNEDHFFTVSVYDARNLRNGAIDYKRFTCSDLRKAAPLWLYVDMGNGCQEDTYSASRFAPNDQNDPRSFDHVIDLDGPELHGPPDKVTIIPENLSVLNILQGLFYSAQLDNFLRILATDDVPNDDHHNHMKKDVPAESEALYNKASLIGAQIELPITGDRQLKLEASSGEELLSVKLETGVQYIIYIEHRPECPIDMAHIHPPQQSHFHRFYSAIKTKSGKRYEITGAPELMGTHCPPCDPLCTCVAVSKHDNLEIME